MTVEADLLVEILEAALGALGSLDEGIAVLDGEARVLFWSPAAEAITGYRCADLISRKFPTELYQVDAGRQTLSAMPLEPRPLRRVERRASERSDPKAGRPVLVTLRHARGHSLPGMLRSTPLRDEMGKRFGTLLRFHPVEEIDTLPRGETAPDDDHEQRIEQSQAGMEDRLDEAWQEWKTNAIPFGVLWVNVDQAASLRKTHGRDAAEAMRAIVERTLLHGLRPSEVLGRWGTHEFLVISHERTAEMLRAHGQHLAGVVRTADFRWWGDRVMLTASVGAGQAGEVGMSETLSGLLRRAQVGLRGIESGADSTGAGKA
jgi:PAS domain S-box-containing protein